ncbi:MAG: PA14 domain-containing protein [Planctomycetota bacterium]|nr:PA14 domain-containing protein [Planctomycetota bacterium]
MPTLPILLLALAPHAATDSEARMLELEAGDRICLLGGAVAERMQHDGWLETLLQLRLPDRELSFRNLGFSGDELSVHQRMVNFGKLPTDELGMNLPGERFLVWDRYLAHCGADVVFAFFGFNESFAGEEGLDRYRADLETFVEHVAQQRYDEAEPPRLVLFSSTPFEDLGDSSLPDGTEHNRRIRLYNEVTASVAAERDVPFVDLFGPMSVRYAESEQPLTINGIHLTEAGNEALAEIVAARIETSKPRPRDAQREERVRSAVVAKNLLWFNHYRATDGYNVYGGRSRERYPRKNQLPDVPRLTNYEVMQQEMVVLDAMAARGDRRIQAAAGGTGSDADEIEVPALIEVPTNKPGPGPAGAHVFLDAEEARKRMTVAPHMRVDLFADESRFPELVNPVQMSFDNRNRLWVAAWPTYPHWRPDLPMNDKLLVLEDVDGDGRADTCEAFADDLHNPTGFEFYDGGVIVAAIPDLWYLADTDGDGRADVRERLLHGISSGDTHHAANSFVLGPGGALYFQEGTFHQSQIETIHGPMRNHNGCVWRFDPRTWRVDRYIPYNFANPHGHVFDRWGQDFMTDGTGNVNYYALPFSGFIAHPAKHGGYFPFFRQRSRPCAATEFLSSEHFPAENQGNYLVCNVIGFQGIFQYEVVDDGSGFSAVEVDPIVHSSDANFRPSDVEMGPDGAIYFLDWHNPIIGHLQHHLRDPSRDADHGRVYRVTHEGRALSTPPAIAGQGIGELLELLRSPEDRVRYRVRIELSGRDSDAVVEAVGTWVASLDPSAPGHEHDLLEALWIHQQHDRTDRELLVRLLGAEDPRARAAATRVLRYMRRRISEPLDLLRVQANDEHPRVRLEAVVAASDFQSSAAAEVALEVLRRPSDKFLDYALRETMRALEAHWREALAEGKPLAVGNPAGIEYLLERVGPEELVRLPRVPTVLQALLTRHGVDEGLRLDAAAELAREHGSSIGEEIVSAIEAVDLSEGMHTAHVLHGLAGLLSSSLSTELRPPLAELAARGHHDTTRELAYAALAALDGSFEDLWEEAAGSPDALRAMLGGVCMADDPDLRTPLYSRIRPLMFSLPAHLARNQRSRAGGEPGLAVSAFEPAPSNARLETLAGLTPTERFRAPNFTHELPINQRSDSYGLRFEGALRVPVGGRYTFSTRSDDGSRLYVDGTCVVNNDGAHGTAERSGSIDLEAGRHPLTVTFYDQGGAQHLSVSWQGPGFSKRPIPDEALGSDGSRAVRSAAVRAMAFVPGHDEHKLADASRLIGEGLLLGEALELLGEVDVERASAESLRSAVDAIAAFASSLAPRERTRPEVLAAVELGRELAGSLPPAQADAARGELAGLGGSIVLIRTLPHRMLYDVTEFWVSAGEPVAVLFQNNDLMPHNLVITAPGALERVGRAAEAQTGEEDDTEAAFIPESAEVLWHTGLLNPGDSERLSFVAPSAPGDYPFVCTFPGHWAVMNGVMHVVDEATDGRTAARREAEETAVPTREFVRDWTTEELVPLVASDWMEGRSLQRGRDLFAETGCIKCHSFGGEGTRGGPDLSESAEKYTPAEHLRHIIEPSLEILEGYEAHYIRLWDGTSVIGRVLSEDELELSVLENLQEPERVTLVDVEEIEERRITPLSPMPTGLLVTLDADELLDLLAYLRSEGTEDGR